MVLAGMEQLIKERDNAIQQNKELLQKLEDKDEPARIQQFVDDLEPLYPALHKRWRNIND